MLALVISAIGLALVACYWRFVYFFRDPERRSPPGRNVVSPADGTIIYVRKILKGRVPIAVKGRKEIALGEVAGTDLQAMSPEGYIIGIFMSLLDVHVNRVPITGKVDRIWRTRSARNRSMARMTVNKMLRREHIYSEKSSHLLENERITTLIRGSVPVYVVQIADMYVSNIECWVKEGQDVEKGTRLGRIRMGSQVDTILPVVDGMHITVEEGQHVRAGETVLAMLPNEDTVLER